MNSLASSIFGPTRSLPFPLMLLLPLFLVSCQPESPGSDSDGPRQRILINDGWSFFKYESPDVADSLFYDVRPPLEGVVEARVADAKPSEALELTEARKGLKPWIMPTANGFIRDTSKHYVRPEENPGADFPFVQSNFDDSEWDQVNLPHDWAISGPFQTGSDPEVGGGMGRLPVNGVGWYRRKLDIPLSDEGKRIYLDLDGAMSYAMVWLNGSLVGGWPYGYNSWRLDLTPYIKVGTENQLAIRVDNPNHSARWYPGGGLYRDVWITKTQPVHVAQWGTFITTRNVSHQSAVVDLSVTVNNHLEHTAEVTLMTTIYALDNLGNAESKPAVAFPEMMAVVPSGQKTTVSGIVEIQNPHLWGPPPTQKPHLYMAETAVMMNGKVVDRYATRFGIRAVEFSPDEGVIINGERVYLKGVNQHHDLGALGAAFNLRAAERQLEILREMGCNAIRMAHNPPAPGLLELTDRMGFLVIDEIFDSWERKKTPHDFHLIFPDWWEADTRAFVRRDRNSPSVIMWSFGNEVGEQYTGDEGAEVARKVHQVVREEDPSRPTTIAMNFAKTDFPIAAIPDVIGLNYQGEGIRQEPEFEGTDRIRTAPQYEPFHERFPEKLIYSSETASALSSRGVYLFPVSEAASAPVRDGRGGDSRLMHVSAYELHAVDFGSSPEKVFGSLERHPFVGGEFVWTGWDYLGEPTPYYEARSSYSGIIDLAGFKKDRFYLYQSHWRPDLPMVHILPHWNWKGREGLVTPVHVFTSGDEAELFLNGNSLGRKKKEPFRYRLRWDDVKYEPGILKVVAYKEGRIWAEAEKRTSGKAARIQISADRSELLSSGTDLSFITVVITDIDGIIVPDASNLIEFNVEGPAELVATDNGDPTDMTAFHSASRKAFNGMALAIVRPKAGMPGKIVVSAKVKGMEDASLELTSH